MTYNVENLFDTEADSIKNDREFLPSSTRRWTYTRYKAKLDNLARCIIATGGWQPPALVALCEVENERVLRDFTHYSALREARYRYVVTQSPDERGINTALLYQPEHFRMLQYEGHRIRFSFKRNARPTRDILHVSGRILSGDTLDIFVVHLPSRSSGKKASEPYRICAAARLKELADSVILRRAFPLIAIMGDFNDHPSNRIFKEVLQAETPPAHCTPPTGEAFPERLYNLMNPLKDNRSGTYQYQGRWEILDHIVVNGNLLLPHSPLYIPSQCAEIVRHPFLLEQDAKSLTSRPFRTYYGYRYHGGYSDHLPVTAQCILQGD